MKTSLKKLVAGASILALVAMNALTSVNGAYVSVGISAVNLGALSNDVIDDKVTVTIPANTVSADGKTLVIAVKDKSGIALDLDGKISGVTNTTTADITNIANGVISYVVTTAATDVTFDFTPGVANNFGISVVGDNGKIGSSVAYFGGANQVTVSAYVLPILSMSVVGNNVNFGELVADTAKTASLNTLLTVNTNAANGYTLKVKNSGLKDGGKQIPDAGINENLTQSTGYGYGINATIAAGTTIDLVASAAGTVDANFDGTGYNEVTGLSTSDATLATAGGPVAAQVTTVSYRAKVSPLQPTGNYADVVTYTVTGNF